MTLLTRVENVLINLVPHFLSARGHVRVNVGKRYWEWKNWRLTNEEFTQFVRNTYANPYKFAINNKNYWLFEGRFYKDAEGLTHEDVKALLISRKQLQQSRIKRAKTIAASPTQN